MNPPDKSIVFAAYGEELPDIFSTSTQLPLVIVVGLTGVGKSTVIELLQQQLAMTLLPNRRQITDDNIIGRLQQEDGMLPTVVNDRIQRFEYTARYRARYPGGMAHALSRLAIDPDQAKPTLFFDGLRGLNEVKYAVENFPQARFIMLDAPDLVRFNRLLRRTDIFDAARLQPPSTNQDLVMALPSVPNIDTVFDQEQLVQIAHGAADLPATEVIKKVSIIVKERHNYDPRATRDYLSQNLRPTQFLLLDTATQSPAEIAAQIVSWLTP